MKGPFFLAEDGEGHWYLVPASSKEEWDRWNDLDEDHPEVEEGVPGFAVRIGCGVSAVKSYLDEDDEFLGGCGL